MGNPEQFGFPVGEDGYIQFVSIHTDFKVESIEHYKALVAEMIRIAGDYDNEVMPILILDEQ